MTVPSLPRADSIAIALAFAVTSALFIHRAHRMALDRVVTLEAAIAGVIGAMLGSRLAAWLLLAGPDVSGTDAIRGAAGSVSWGAYVGGAAAALLVIRGRGLRPTRFLDAAAPAMAAGIAVARLGCFAAGDDFGRRCDAAWCVAYPPGTLAYQWQLSAGLIAPGASHSLPVFPLQLLFALAAVIAGAAGAWWSSRRDARPGSTTLVVVIAYTATRAMLEPLREPLGTTPLGSAPGLLIALICLAGAAVIWVVRTRASAIPG